MARAEVITTERVDRYIAAVVLAFATDPFVRWILPEPGRFLTYCRRLTRLHGERTAANGGAWGLADGRGAAFWYTPGVHPDGAALEAVFVEAGILARVSGVWERVAAYEPSVPHWYLRQIGVDPVLQRGGYGSLLLEAALVEVDRRGDVAYLEATSPAGRTLYERHGFSVLGEVTVGGSPPLWPMARESRDAPPT